MKVWCVLIVWTLIAGVVMTSTNAERKYGKRGNACNVSEESTARVVEACNCSDPESSDCQLQVIRGKSVKYVGCKNTVSEACLLAVKNQAIAYSTASNANDPECKYGDANYEGSREAWLSCSLGWRDIACDVKKESWTWVAESCNCIDEESPDCQLKFIKRKISCKNNVSEACFLAVKNLAIAYSSASNANDPECKYGDINYEGSREAWLSCSLGA